MQPFNPDDCPYIALAGPGAQCPAKPYLIAIQKEFIEIKQRVEQLEAKLDQNSSNSNQPPSGDSPYAAKPDKSARSKSAKSRKKRKGIRQQCLRPTDVIELQPGPCACGCSRLTDPEPYYIHQLIELPFIQLIVQHLILFRGRCQACGKTLKAVIPREQRTGFGPRISAMIAEMAGTQADSRRATQTFCASVLGLPISLGGIQKILDRVSSAIEPHYEAIGEVARAAPVNHVDETSWRRKGLLKWLWSWAARWRLFS